MTLAELRELAERLPPGGGVMLPRETVLELCGAVVEVGDDFTVAQLAERLGRKPSTVRGWCDSGELPGAYRLNGREWRIPPAVIEAFLAGQRPSGEGKRRRRGPSLSDWRNVRATGADAVL